VNVAWRAWAWAKHAGVDVESGNYRTRKTQPFVRKVSLSGSGRSIKRPSSSREIASRGVLTTYAEGIRKATGRVTRGRLRPDRLDCL
jgi:hypothetical protein